MNVASLQSCLRVAICCIQDNEKNAVEGDDMPEKDGLSIRGVIGSGHDKGTDREQHGTDQGMICHRYNALRRAGRITGPPLT
jgi:hypothetical protein